MDNNNIHICIHMYVHCTLYISIWAMNNEQAPCYITHYILCCIFGIQYSASWIVCLSAIAFFVCISNTIVIYSSNSAFVARCVTNLNGKVYFVVSFVMGNVRCIYFPLSNSLLSHFRPLILFTLCSLSLIFNISFLVFSFCYRVNFIVNHTQTEHMKTVTYWTFSFKRHLFHSKYECMIMFICANGHNMFETK